MLFLQLHQNLTHHAMAADLEGERALMDEPLIVRLAKKKKRKVCLCKQTNKSIKRKSEVS